METVHVKTSAQRARELAEDPEKYLREVRAEAKAIAGRTPNRTKRAIAQRMEDQPRRDIELGHRRLVWVGRTLWIRTYREGGFDGYRTLAGRRTVCGNVARAWADRRAR